MPLRGDVRSLRLRRPEGYTLWTPFLAFGELIIIKKAVPTDFCRGCFFIYQLSPKAHWDS